MCFKIFLVFVIRVFLYFEFSFYKQIGWILYVIKNVRKVFLGLENAEFVTICYLGSSCLEPVCYVFSWYVLCFL